MKILIANPGSSSMKCQLLEMPSERTLGRVKVERVGNAEAPTEWVGRDGIVHREVVAIPDRAAAIRYVLERLTEPGSGAVERLDEVAAVGFKAVYAKDITGCRIIDGSVLTAMADYSEVVAPLHNPVYIQAIESFREVLPDTPLVALFENFPFDSLPDHATVYPIPWDWTVRHRIRRHLFHGASHFFVNRRVEELIGGETAGLRVITCHLGGSSTIMAFRGDSCVEGTGGFTLQCGVPFSVRASDMDPFIIPFLVSRGEGSIEAVTERMMSEGGLSGISGMGFDFRDLEQAAGKGDERAGLAIDAYVYAVRRYIGAYRLVLGGLDAITLAGGTGEAGVEMRRRILTGLEELGIVLDEARNAECVQREGRISAEKSSVQVWVVPTNEEIVVAREAYKLLTTGEAAPDWLAGAPLFDSVTTSPAFP